MSSELFTLEKGALGTQLDQLIGRVGRVSDKESHEVQGRRRVEPWKEVGHAVPELGEAVYFTRDRMETEDPAFQVTQTGKQGQYSRAPAPDHCCFKDFLVIITIIIITAIMLFFFEEEH